MTRSRGRLLSSQLRAPRPRTRAVGLARRVIFRSIGTPTPRVDTRRGSPPVHADLRDNPAEPCSSVAKSGGSERPASIGATCPDRRADQAADGASSNRMALRRGRRQQSPTTAGGSMQQPPSDVGAHTSGQGSRAGVHKTRTRGVGDGGTRGVGAGADGERQPTCDDPLDRSD
jgi:hypothetical protein